MGTGLKKEIDLAGKKMTVILKNDLGLPFICRRSSFNRLNWRVGSYLTVLPEEYIVISNKFFTYLLIGNNSCQVDITSQDSFISQCCYQIIENINNNLLAIIEINCPWGCISGVVPYHKTWLLIIIKWLWLDSSNI